MSGSFGSRQEEAQRLGRLLRPKADGRTARFYAIVSRDTVDADFAQNRQRFLAEQGYAYRITDADDVGVGLTVDRLDWPGPPGPVEMSDAWLRPGRSS